MLLDYYKLQNEVMKSAWMLETNRKAMNWNYGEDEENLYLTDGYAFYVIPKPFAYLNIETVFRNKTPFTGHKGIIDAAWNTCEATMTNRGVILPDGKKTAVAFQIDNAQQQETYIDKDRLKYFDVSECRFRTKDNRNLVYIYAAENLIGAVLPVRIDV